jgi:aryl-alcohol dehydrogenase-like predicted oxidoreductase
MGAMTFGSQADREESRRIVDRCLDVGINFFDTANVYNQGKSEELLGEALGSRRQGIILASKVRGVMKVPTDHSGLSREAIRCALNASLDRLQTDYLDIYYLHLPDYDTPIEESLAAMDELKQEGKIRYLATSNYSAWQMCEMFTICEREGYAKPWIAQPMYNLAARGIEQEYMAFTKKYGISNIVYNPLAGGLLTGKQKRNSAPLANTRFDGNQMYLDRFWHNAYFDAVAEVKAIAQDENMTPIDMAFRWLLAQEQVHCILLGASSLNQLDQNLEALKASPLTDEQLSACDEVWHKLRGPTPNYNR